MTKKYKTGEQRLIETVKGQPMPTVDLMLERAGVKTKEGRTCVSCFGWGIGLTTVAIIGLIIYGRFKGLFDITLGEL